MRALSASELLNVWEWGRTEPPFQRALMLLAASCPDKVPEELAMLPIGRRDALLLKLRAWTCGPVLESMVACTACKEQFECAFTVEDIGLAPDENPPEHYTLRTGGYDVAFRLPNSTDLAEIAACKTIESGRRRLLERCLLRMNRGDDEIAVAQVPEAVVEAIAEHMAQADAQADVRFALTCPACGHTWESIFDIVSYFWSEIDAWAHRTLDDIHTLAAAYCWTEAEILALSARRRQFYIDKVVR